MQQRRIILKTYLRSTLKKTDPKEKADFMKDIFFIYITMKC